MNGTNEPKLENKLEATPSLPSHETPKFEIDLRGYWDTKSRNDMFVAKLRQLPFYTPTLLYSGFTGSRARNAGEVYANTEDAIVKVDIVNPLDYAMKSLVDFKVPKVAVYDDTKMTPAEITFQYRIDDPSALLAVLHIKE